MSAPDGTSTLSLLRQVGPGKYQARIAFRPATPGAYTFALADTPELTRGARMRSGTRSLFYGYSDEYRALYANVDLLKVLCERTGGKIAPRVEDVFARQGDGGLVSKPLWQLFAAMGLVLFLIELLLRRVSAR
jgi:hypothetical protein